MSGWGRQIAILLSLWLCLTATQLSRAQSTGVAVLLSDGSTEYRKVSDTIAAGLAKANGASPRLQTLNADQSGMDKLAELLMPSTRLLVTVGTRATRLALYQKIDVPILAVFLPKLSYDAILAPLDRESLPKSLSAIYLDPAPGRQIELAQSILQGSAVIGVVASGQAKPLLDPMAAKAKEVGLTLKTAAPAGKDRVAEVLDEALADVDLLVTIFDPMLVDRRVVTQLLYAAFGKALPVIGYSEAMVNAGAIAAVYSDSEQIGREAVELITAALRHPAALLGLPRHPKYFHVACNASVARYLNLERACAPDLAAHLGAEP